MGKVYSDRDLVTKPTLPPAADHKWLHDFQLQCMFPVADIVASPTEPSYPDILAMDSKIRDFEVPNVLQMIDHDGVAPAHPKALQQAMVACTREIGMYYTGNSLYLMFANDAT